MKINLTSDTVTRPTPAMLEVMFRAEVGDDVFRQDPTVNALEEKVASLFGKEAAIYCPSGTMTNQIALAVHCSRLEEVILNELSHVYQYETGGYSFTSHAAVNLLRRADGKITADQVAEAIRPDFDWLPHSRLVVIENTCNKGGGTIYRLEEIEPIRDVCREHGLKMHLDGARLFNALVETGETPAGYGKQFDSISICLSKGLGAPVGSVLAGDAAFIKQARRMRKSLGGGMRQAGFLAAAGIFALEHHVDRLKEDNERARSLGATLEEQPYVKEVRPVQSNIVIFELKPPMTAASFLEWMEKEGIQAAAISPQAVRFVTHLDFTGEMLERVLSVLKNKEVVF